MMAFSRFRLFTFDVTDTLLQFRSSPGKQYGEIGAMFGVLCNNNELATNFKLNWYKFNKEHPNFGLKTKIGWENWWLKLITATFRESNVKITDDKLIQLSTHLLDVFKTSTCWQSCFGAFELLSYLKLQQQNLIKNGHKKNELFKIGVISNFDHRLDQLLINMKMNQYFDFIINSYDAGCEKPQKEIFTKAMQNAKLLNLKESECLHIGDTPIIDYIGAREAGWHSALIHAKGADYLKEKYGEKINTDHIFSSLFDFHKKAINNNIKW